MAIKLRHDFDARMLRVEAKRSKNGAQARRLLALPAIYEGTILLHGLSGLMRSVSAKAIPIE